MALYPSYTKICQIYEKTMNLRKWFEYITIRRSGYFDLAYYLINNPDVRKADIDPLWHFIAYGWKE